MDSITGEGRSVPGTTLVEVLRRQAERLGEGRAYTFLLDGETAEAHLTYAELDRRARGLAATLAREGVGAGDRVLLLYPPGFDYVAAFFGCLYAGAVAVPAYPPRSRRPSARLQSIQESAGAKAVLATAAVLSGLDRQLPRRPGVLWQAAEGVEMERGAEEWRDPGTGGEALAFLQYTSGSTAAPKGVMLRHANLLANLEQIRRSFAQTPEERTVIWLPPYHDMGLIGGILTPLYAGNTAVLLSPVSFLQRPLRWLRAISRYRGTTSGGPNFAYDLCVERIGAEEREKLDLSSWTLAFNGAEPVRAATLERFAAAFAPCGFRKEAFLPCYGLAEGTLLAACGRRGDGAEVAAFASAELERHHAVAVAPEEVAAGEARALVGCGVAPEGARLQVVDPERSVPCAAGEVGEIWIAGPAVAAGYWGLPEATAASFGARTADGGGPWLRTGDLGFLDGHGDLFVTGRIKDLIILRGRNHYPQDVELTVERAHPALRPGCGAAFAVEEERRGAAGGGPGGAARAPGGRSRRAGGRHPPGGGGRARGAGTRGGAAAAGDDPQDDERQDPARRLPRPLPRRHAGRPGRLAGAGGCGSGAGGARGSRSPGGAPPLAGRRGGGAGGDDRRGDRPRPAARPLSARFAGRHGADARRRVAARGGAVDGELLRRRQPVGAGGRHPGPRRLGGPRLGDRRRARPGGGGPSAVAGPAVALVPARPRPAERGLQRGERGAHPRRARRGGAAGLDRRPDRAPSGAAHHLPHVAWRAGAAGAFFLGGARRAGVRGAGGPRLERSPAGRLPGRRGAPAVRPRERAADAGGAAHPRRRWSTSSCSRCTT